MMTLGLQTLLFMTLDNSWKEKDEERPLTSVCYFLTSNTKKANIVEYRAKEWRETGGALNSTMPEWHLSPLELIPYISS